MKDLTLNKKDRVRLKSYSRVEINDEYFKGPYTGINLRDNSDVIFNQEDIDCYKLFNVHAIGGDKTNVWFFPTNTGYPNDAREAVANWAKYEHNELFFDVSIEDILNKHMYLADNSQNLAYYYGENMIVLFYDINQLEFGLRIDAENYTLKQ